MITPLKQQIDDGYGSSPVTVAQLDIIATWLAESIKSATPESSTITQIWATRPQLRRIYGLSENEVTRFINQAISANKLPVLEPKSTDGMMNKRRRYHIASFRQFMEHENNLAAQTTKNL